jgi:hypothetical protein
MGKWMVDFLIQLQANFFIYKGHLILLGIILLLTTFSVIFHV